MNTVTPTELAQTLESDPKTVRKFLRSITEKEQQPGRGHRWEISAGKRDINRLRKQFDNWREVHTRQAS